MAKKKARFQSLLLKPKDGANLFTALSAESAGIANYVEKEDWRRELDVEVRREGHEYFNPGGTSNAGEAFPGNTDDITLIHMARRPNGQVAIIVGTETTLYRYKKLDDITYVHSSYTSNNYFSTSQPNWITIGSGFTTKANGAKRWKAVNLNGYTVLNNGYDLPVSYRLEDQITQPIYELREAGISTVGCIASYNGILMLGDVTEIDALDKWKSSSTPYGTVTEPASRNHARLIWSQINDPRRFSASNKGSIEWSSRVITLDTEAKSYEQGDQITIIGAGIEGGNLTSRITLVHGNLIYIEDEASVTVTSALISQTDETNSIIGFEDIEDDGSGIINMAPLQNTLAIYKDTSIFIAEYTGVVTAPFKFRLIKVPDSKTLYYKNTLIAVKESVHIYAGRDNFYAFDLSTRGPKELIPGQGVKDLFYGAVDITNTDDVFTADNVLTNEVWFIMPNKTICLDYIKNTVSTTGGFTAAATVKKPPSDKQNWFLMGTTNGVVLRYGLTNETQSTWSGKKAIYYRMEANPYSATQNLYQSKLKSGLGNFGDAYNEKDIRGYVVQLASQQDNNAALNIKLYGYENPYSDPNVLTGSSAYQITNPKGQNLVPVYFRQHLFQDEIMATGTTNVKLAGRIFDIGKVNSSSEIRTPAIT